MDSEFTDYDQLHEAKLMLDNREHICHDGSTSRFLVTLSSCSDQGSSEEATSDNDFVFLPAPIQNYETRNQQQQRREFTEPAVAHRSNCEAIFRSELKVHRNNKDLSLKQSASGLPTNPLLAINRNPNQGNNPFGNAPQSPRIDPMGSGASRKQRYSDSAFECVPDSIKPIGILELSPAIANNKMAELMQQIVIRSDSISIAIPCNYCFEPVSCPPADVSNWLDHMSTQHNCKVCPICDRLVGLGPTRDLEIMRRHVVEDLDENWLEKRASRVTFTFGLQQQWFSGNQCAIKEPKYK